jgi:hypothetical protein
MQHSIAILLLCFTHTFAQTIYGSGYNDNGQAGAGYGSKVVWPIEFASNTLLAGKTPVFVHAGDSTSHVITADGGFYSWVRMITSTKTKRVQTGTIHWAMVAPRL